MILLIRGLLGVGSKDLSANTRLANPGRSDKNHYLLGQHCGPSCFQIASCLIVDSVSKTLGDDEVNLLGQRFLLLSHYQSSTDIGSVLIALKLPRDGGQLVGRSVAS